MAACRRVGREGPVECVVVVSGWQGGLDWAARSARWNVCMAAYQYGGMSDGRAPLHMAGIWLALRTVLRDAPMHIEA